MDEAELWDLMNAAWDRISPEQKKLWDAIRVSPRRWTQHPYGETNGGFWVVALIGETVMWYNDLEHGFQRSTFVNYGEIAEFGSNQFDLEEALQHVVNQLKLGHATEPRSSPPLSGEYRR